MTRGPVPIVAIRQAIRNAAERGTVMDRDLIRESRTAFILFCAWISVFVRIRRSPLRILSPEDCAAKFKADIHGLRRVPLTSVTARELWLLSPWDSWQYFRILDDRVIEIRADGVPFLHDGAGEPAPSPVREDEHKRSPSPGGSPPGGDT
ncbi:hypothetical protein [uncultured Methanoregula sp.]|uniref:hypothetical protein n=1 Tax=uncultured Methanoregula sp. TaxID=1005933 RepID=UPI002AABA59F|nr:hypothetical protein [uncultured Methanoregula sp.]